MTPAGARFLLTTLVSVAGCGLAAAEPQPDAATEARVAEFVLELDGAPDVERARLRPVPSAARDTVQLVGERPSVSVTIVRRATFHGYARTTLEVANTGEDDLPLKRIIVADIPAPDGARVAGECAGSPVIAGAEFLGVEHPFAENTVARGRIRCALPIMLPLRPGEKATVSFVRGGASEPSQLRRAFAAYLERERPRAHAPFLLHNTWYNLGYSNPFSERDELQLIARLGHELVEKRGVRIDGFVLDDGWDDTRTLWRFNAGWPEGLKNMRAVAARWGAAPGMWLSPWGGYNRPKEERLAAATSDGFETRDGSFSLAGPRYYERFRELCVRQVREGGVAFFKFDGIGAKATGVIDPAAGRDFDAMLRLVAELRAQRPGLYVSQTVGTWPSPWWLLHVDTIWRGGNDHDFVGVGSDRQQWITYRDAQVYANVVRRAPLFPLGSLMLHGVILARHAERLATAERADFASEVRSFFGSGVQLQELYLSPELVRPENWDDLAVAANWARRQADVLADTHWVGGDPARLEPYGWAAWTPRLGILTVRNPSAQPAGLTLDVGCAFELPTGAEGRFLVTSAFADTAPPVTRLEAGRPIQLRLEPFQVLVLEARPTAN